MTPERRAGVVANLAAYTWPEWVEFLTEDDGYCVWLDADDPTIVPEALRKRQELNAVETVPKREWLALEWARWRIRDLVEMGLSAEDITAQIDEPARLRGMLDGELAKMVSEEMSATKTRAA